MEDNVTLCTNCQRQIAASNFVTHNVHCQRNLVKCENCGEAVPRSSQEEHHAEFHALVPCPNCYMKIERILLDKHQKTACKLRQQNCQYCELEFAASDFQEHENYCGSRTKHCEECGEYVMLKYEQLHLDSNHGFLKLDDEPGPSAKWIKNDLESLGPIKTKSNNNMKRPQLLNGKFNNTETDDIDDLPHMLSQLNKPKVWAPPRHGGVAYPLSGAPQRTISPPPFRRSSYSDDENEGDLVALPCEFCNAMIPSNQLLIHQTGCQPEIASFGFQSKPSNFHLNFASKDTQDSLSESVSFVDVVGVSDNESDIEVLPTVFEGKKTATDEKKVAYDDTELPCEFCGAGFPPSLLLDHQDVCEFHPKNWRDASPVREKQTHLSTSPKLSVFDDRNLFSQQKQNKDYNLYEPENAGVTGGRVPNPLSDSRYNGVPMSNDYEWDDLNLARPSSATGAIPKAKAGKLNIAWQVNQEISRPRSSNNKVVTDKVPDAAAGHSHNQPPRKRNDKSPLHKKFQDCDEI